LLQLEPSADAFGEPSATPVQFDVEGCVFVGVQQTPTVPMLDVSAPTGARMGVNWINSVKWQGDWNVVAGFSGLLRMPESDRSAGMTTSPLRTYSYSEWLTAFRLSSSKQAYQPARPSAIRSVWDASLPHGKDWLMEFANLPAAFAEEAAFQGLP
jgi:hypothetical protein